MILILRKIKQTLFNNGQFRRYLLYALGEMVLVVIGILIALQINNLNAEKQKEASLQSYLGSIARNISNDLTEVGSIRSRRQTAIGLAGRAVDIQLTRETYSVEDVALLSHAFGEASEPLHFNANMSGYEALKSSGVLDRMQGRDIENLLYDYYDTVSRISQEEESHNEYLQLHRFQVTSDWPRNLADWEFADPGALTPERMLELQPAFMEVATNPNLISLYLRTQSGASLLLDYDRLDRLGRAFIRTIGNDSMELDETTLEILENIYAPEEGAGYPDVLTEGQVYWANYNMTHADSLVRGTIGSSLDAIYRDYSVRLKYPEQREDHLHVHYPGGATDWAVLFFSVRGSSNKRPSQDFSMYDKLVLELKGDAGGETIDVNLKDRDDPDDGTQTNIELQLTDQWKRYEINLADFKTADLKKLHVVPAFLFDTEPQSFSVRTIRFQ
jgi:hypothetical protein